MAAAAVVFVQAQANDDARRAALQRAALTARQAATDIGTSVAAIQTAVTQLAANPGTATAFTATTPCSLNFSAGGHVEVLTREGRIVCSSKPGVAPDADAGAPWLRAAATRPLVLAPLPDAVGGGKMLLVTAPVPGRGIVAAGYDLGAAGDALALQLGGPDALEILLTTADGRTALVRSIDARRSTGRPLAGTPFAAPVTGGHRGLDGVRRLYATTTVPGLGWRIFAGEDESHALAPAATLFRRELAIIGAGLVVILGALLVIHRRITRPIAELSRAARAAEGGTAFAPVGARGPREVAGLADDFTHLMGEVEHELAARRTSEDRLRETVAELERSDEQRGRLLGSLVTAQEEERRRIASDVHDDSIQVMVAALMRIGVIREHALEPAVDDQLARLHDTCEQAVRRLRHLVFQLRPPSLDRDGLAAALSEYLEQWTKESGLTYVVDDRLSVEPPVDIRAILFRIAQEALTNVRKHARATTVTITLGERPPGVLLRVQDDGIGYSPERRPSGDPIGHFGLISMRERADVAGGWWRIAGKGRGDAGTGTVVEAWIPVPGEPHAA